MNKSLSFFLCAVFLLLVAVPLHAQDGCVNSPENPTIILALVGSAGGAIAAARAQWKSRRNSLTR
jgi:XrtJ-associated TM-motif-TM protein